MTLGAGARSPSSVSEWELSASGQISPAQLRTMHTSVPQTDVRERYEVNLKSFFLTEEC
jgi:hypothetical protein